MEGMLMVLRGVMLASLICLLACGAQPDRQETEAPRLDLGRSIRLGGRPFLVEARSAALGPQKEHRFVGASIHGDDRTFSFVVMDAERVELAVQRDMLTLNGHRFQVTSMPGEYVIDDKRVSLPAGPQVHCIVDGKFVKSVDDM